MDCIGNSIMCPLVNKRGAFRSLSFYMVNSECFVDVGVKRGCRMEWVHFVVFFCFP